ncbi:plasma membrane ascorbate-dependent reductase CYBRD1-like isoform X2 [Penaeus japonicus]|uniref:plasma membrane ascorbate-dependent reductase CYBRD1-like isoform X2 n=1 Tax=Penaeus japonicus TaxID=27405 RepID=UPI001C712342|nr:plasma membrane ascorbate-dependent reductase CYBRD1-like isoform X2 [Penaeus japonicus]
MSLRKDATISSKMSEYDNVPVLPGNYHDFKDQNDLPLPPSQHLNSFPVDDPPPVPPHQTITAGTTQPQQQYPQQQHCPQQYPQQQQSLQYQQQEQQYLPPANRPLQFPTEKAPQQDYDSLDARLVMQRQKQLLQQQGEQQQQLQLQTGQRRSVVITTSKAMEKERSHRQSYGGGEMSVASSLIFYFLVFLAEILMFGLLSLVLFWVVYYRGGFKWREDPAKEFNFHPVLMVAGFIFFMGHAMLVYRLFRCCNKLTAKLLHTFLYLLAIPCIVVGVITAFDSHNLRVPAIPNLYSLHSWLGLVTIGLFALQLVVGFFSFWLLLCCEQGTASFRSGLVPVHATFGIITFMLAIATCVTGYTEKAFFVMSGGEYSKLPEEAWVVNAQAACLAGLAILMGFLLYTTRYARASHPVAIVDPPSNSHYVMTQKTYYYRDQM